MGNKKSIIPAFKVTESVVKKVPSNNISKYIKNIVALDELFLSKNVAALNKKLVVKICRFNDIYYRDLHAEAERLKFCNSINDLLVRYEDFWVDDFGNSFLVMERLYPLQYRSISIGERIRFFNEFEVKLKELHKEGFVFGDFFETIIVNDKEIKYNFILTSKGIRLIDTERSFIKNEQTSRLQFDQRIISDLRDLERVKSIICNI